MIEVNGKTFHLKTARTSYLFKANPIGLLEHLYYGKRIPSLPSYPFLEEQCLYGGGTMEREGDYALYPNCASLEFSTFGRGDYRAPSVQLDQASDRVNEFRYVSYEIQTEDAGPAGLPSAAGKKETLILHLLDEKKRIALRLFYSLFDGSDVILRRAEIENRSDAPIQVEKLASFQLDLMGDGYSLDSLDGAWAKERQIHTHELKEGTWTVDSRYGYSSAQHNPYVVLKRKGCGLHQGECFGFNLLYSGSFQFSAEQNNYHKLRLMEGIHPDFLRYEVRPGEIFASPEATLCFSFSGTNGLTSEYHRFVNEHIVRGEWKKKERPIVLNNWEATYFDFTEERLLEIATRGKELGAELFVLDDGWFGKRDNDRVSLGDWGNVNKAKLPHGLRGLSEKIHSMGLLFGLWFEPEMVSLDSDLYRAHPGWAVAHPAYTPLTERNQYVLDLANGEVVDYLIETLSKVFQEASLDYVKWDCNRNISDPHSPTLEGHQGEFHHRYMLGFYRLVKTLTERFPNILFESCSMGGNRVDLGLLCYMPQFWCSDNTDCYDRAYIQEGTLTGYPQSTIGSHVSASPNHYTMRPSFFESRFNVACFGAFGYELDLGELSLYDLKAMKEQIAWYKKHRRLLQYGRYAKLASLFDSEEGQWEVVSEDGGEAILALQKKTAEPYAAPTIIRPVGLDPKGEYRFETRKQYFPCLPLEKPNQGVAPMPTEGDLMTQIEATNPRVFEIDSFVLPGEALLSSGVRLSDEWLSTNGAKRRLMLDFGSRLYEIQKL